MKPETRFFPDLESLSREAAHFLFQACLKGVAEKGLFTLALSGGNTPRRLYELFSRAPLIDQMPWDQIHFFWGDERCIAPDHPESNYGLAFQTFLSKIPIPGKNIHRIRTEIGPGPVAAVEYEEEIRYFFQVNTQPGEKPAGLKPPPFDLILLGIGTDGHTASLFPGDPALEDRGHLTALVPLSPLPPFLPRITMTLSLINQAEAVVFLVSGKEKTEVIRTIHNDPEKARSLYPAARVNPKGKCYWFIVA
ncbi:MAG: 6-phosphogluconolactonase [Desulfobacca sp.]|nr:6-phosphogluconolactonase [Desulfobacca sp.]